MGAFFLLQFDRILDCFVRRDFNFHHTALRKGVRNSSYKLFNTGTKRSDSFLLFVGFDKDFLGH